MSTRALRKLQREQEIEKQIAAATAAYEEQEESEEDVPVSQPQNAFDMLNEADDDEDSEDEGLEEPPNTTPSPTIESTQPAKAKKKKKKKQKKKAAAKTEGIQPKEDSEDEIDRALREIAAKTGVNEQEDEDYTVSWEASATKLLAIDHKALNPTNEMRSLFGNVALQNHDAPRRSQSDNEPQGGVDLGTALSARYSMASRGKELGALASRRNCFVQGRAEWPLATSGGLSMECLSSENAQKHYNLMHNRQYQEVQSSFRAAVNSMQADQMIGLLRAVPYHVATLLQVSEIAKHQGDHSVSGDLLERALFTIGRSVHSSFPAALRGGVARLDFLQPRNRELYLAIWRYTRNLEMRGTWRTCFEWAKILLQFDPKSDPFGVTLMIDQLALRGRQHVQLLELASEQAYGNTWKHLPNIQISLTLALLRSQKPKEARRQLAVTMHKYPYILQALASSLEISPMPKSIWGKLPSSAAEKLYTELYVTRAKDLWNTPETTALISEVAETLDYYTDVISSSAPAAKLEISLEEARHIMLLEIPHLIALLPRTFTTMPTSSSDVLPPPSSASDFTSRAPTYDPTGAPSSLPAIFAAAGNMAGAPLQGAGSMLQRILSWFHAPAGPADANGDNNARESEGEAAFRAVREGLQAASGGQEITDEMVEQLIRTQLGVHDGDDEITAAGLGMAGSWGDSHDDDVSTSSDMPELENISIQQQAAAPAPSNPHAARVEDEDEDEDEDHPPASSTATNLTGQAILRRVDSNDEVNTTTNSNGVNPSIPSTTNTNTNPSTTTEANTTTNPDPDNTVLNSDDPQRIQRYLLTTGLTTLQANPDTKAHYIKRLKLLRQQQQNWVLNMISQRSAEGKETANMIRQAL